MLAVGRSRCGSVGTTQKVLCERKALSLGKAMKSESEPEGAGGLGNISVDAEWFDVGLPRQSRPRASTCLLSPFIVVSVDQLNLQPSPCLFQLLGCSPKSVAIEPTGAGLVNHNLQQQASYINPFLSLVSPACPRCPFPRTLTSRPL
jgi:hypothetical protein